MSVDDDLYSPILQETPPEREWLVTHQFDVTTGKCMRCGMTYEDYQAYSASCVQKP